METRTFEIGDEQFEVRAANTVARRDYEKSLAKQGLTRDSAEGAMEFVRVLLVSWKRGGKDLVQVLPREKLRDELGQYDSLMMRIVEEAKGLADEINAQYEVDRKN